MLKKSKKYKNFKTGFSEDAKIGAFATSVLIEVV